MSRQYPPTLTHLESDYGFLGLIVSSQIAFVVIATDPLRYRPLMPVAMVEKFGFVILASILKWRGELPANMLAAAAMDLLPGGLFLVAFWVTRGDCSASATIVP